MTTQDGASGGTPTPLTLLMTALGSLTKLESPSEKSWRMLSIFLVAFFFVVGAPAAVAVAVGVTEAPGRRGGIISRMLIVGSTGDDSYALFAHKAGGIHSGGVSSLVLLVARHHSLLDAAYVFGDGEVWQ